MFYLIPILPFEAVFISAGTRFLWSAIRRRYKKAIFTAAASALFAFAIASTSLQLFYFVEPYAYRYAQDEREIGKYIKAHDKGHGFYAFDWRAYETLYYYSGKQKIEWVSEEEFAKGFPVPYFIIFTTRYAPREGQQGIAVRYEGDFLVLAEVFEGNKPASNP